MYTQLRRAGDSDLLSRFTEENVIVLHSRASGNTICFKEGEIEGTGGHGGRGKNVNQHLVLKQPYVLMFGLQLSLLFISRLQE